MKKYYLNLALVVINLIMLGLLLKIFVLSGFSVGEPAFEIVSDQQLELLLAAASRMAVQEAYGASAELYSEYLKLTSKDFQRGFLNSESQGVRLRCAQMYYKNNQPHEALVQLALLRQIPDLPDSLKRETSKLNIELLEALGQTKSARKLADEEVSARPRSTDTVARIGRDHISREEILRYLEILPDNVQSRYSQAEGFRQLISDYLGRELLFRRASRMGLLDSKSARQRFEELKRELAVNLTIDKIRQEQAGSIISAETIAQYFEENQDKYSALVESDSNQVQELSEELKSRIIDDIRVNQVEKRLNDLVLELMQNEDVQLYNE